MSAFTAIKKILPQTTLNALRDIRALRSLSSVVKREFTTKNLITNDNFLAQALLNNQSVIKEWARDKKSISDVLGHQDKYGGVNPGDRRAIYTLIAGLKPKNVLEVGTHIGASTLYIARALKAAGAGTLTTVDILDVNNPNAPWKNIGLHSSPIENAKILECADIINFIKSPSQDYLKNTDEKFDFIFLDGDHGANTVYNEVSIALDVLAPNGTILLHDYYPEGKALFPDKSIIPGPYRALERIKSENEKIMVRPLGALPWETKQGSNMTSLALITAKS